MEIQEKLTTAKKLIKKYNVTAYEISKKTHLTAVGVQKIINGQILRPQKNTLDIIINYINSHYPHNDATDNTNSNNMNSLDSYSQDKINENNIYIEMIAIQRELISQYRKEIEYLRRKLKENTENS